MNNLNDKTIIMIDDNEDDAFISRRLLLKHGVVQKFIHIEEPAKASESILSLVSDDCALEDMIILLDINMPVVSGFEVMQAIRADEKLKKLPVIMLSTSDSGKDIHKSLLDGADGYLTKPFDSDALFQALSQITDSKQRFIPNLVQKIPA